MNDATEKSHEPPKCEKTDQPLEDKYIRSLESCEEKVQKVHERMEGEVEVKSKMEEIKETKVEEIKDTKVEEIKETKVEKLDEKPSVGEEKFMEKEKGKPMVQKELKKSLTENPIRKISDSLPCCAEQSREKIVRNQSDIFSLKEISTTLQTSIFSVNGSPSRKLFRKQEPAGHVFQRSEDRASGKGATPKINRITRENYNDEKRPSSSYRNPLTGTGLSSNDEYKSKGIKRKDGNPLLGLGYDSEVSATASQHRVPPGGFSHKLW